jgi:hypothetical protein
MAVETQQVSMPTYVKHDDLDVTYSGDKQDSADYDVTCWMHPFDGIAYRYIPEEQNWEPSVNVAWVKVRAERDKRIEAFRWKIDRQRDLVDLSLATVEELMPFLLYVQALRDIPQTQTDPLNIVWPIDPTLPVVETPVVEEPAPVVETPVVEEPAPVVEEPAPTEPV